MHESTEMHKQRVAEFLQDKSRKRKVEEAEKNDVEKELKAAMQVGLLFFHSQLPTLLLVSFLFFIFFQLASNYHVFVLLN